MSTVATQINHEHQYLDEVFAKQNIAYLANPLSTAEQRITKLKGLKQSLIKHHRALITALDEDFGGRSRYETLLGEITPSLENIDYSVKRLKKWMQPSRRQVSPMFMPAKAKIIYQPLGVVGIIVPWNYPLFLTLGPLVSALAAGNRVMIKLSEFTPRTAEVIRTILSDVFFEEEVATITGDAGVAEAFSHKPFHHLLFTGATAIGHKVMRAAAEHLTPVTLELGGKSPVIISNDIPLNLVADRMLSGKCINAGQTCVAPDYILCPKFRINELISELKKTFAAMYPTIKNNAQYTSIINERQHQRLQSYIQDAREKGAEVMVLNHANESFDAGTRKMPLHLLLNVNDSMLVMQEEIFGPLLPILAYEKLEEAIDFVNRRPRPLALYYFDFNEERVERVLNRTISGGVCINDTLMHVIQDDIPFGGVGHSGMGHYHGQEGFLTFSKAKSVFSKGKFNSAKMIYPPYGAKINLLLKLKKLG